MTSELSIEDSATDLQDCSAYNTTGVQLSNPLVYVLKLSFAEHWLKRGWSLVFQAADGCFLGQLTLTSPLAVKSSASSTSFKLPTTLPTIFNRLRATMIGGAPARIEASLGRPMVTRVPAGRR